MDQENAKWHRNPNSQYEHFDRLPVLLKRFSFLEKMRIACIYSSKAIKYNPMTDRKVSKPFPWSIEVFVMMSVAAREYGSNTFGARNEQKFIQMCNAIWDATSIIVERDCGDLSPLDVFLPTAGLTQFEFQEMPIIKQYRYWKLFNKNAPAVSMVDEFQKKMGTSYDDFQIFSGVLSVMFFAQEVSRNITIPQSALQYLVYQRFPIAAEKLMITRDGYIACLQTFLKGSPDPYKYVFLVSPSVQFPLISEENKIYFPLPHLLTRSVTSSLFYRITEGNDILRAKIGKHILESYLFEIIRDSNVYDEVYQEKKYRYSGSEASSPDIMARHAESVLFLESKSTVPSLGIRLLNFDSYKSNIEKISDYMVQLYKQILRFESYNPFQGEISRDRNNYWGVVVVLEDAYIPRQLYYKKAQEILRLSSDSIEWTWFLTHIKITSLYEIERLSFTKLNIIDACETIFSDDPYTYPFVGYPKYDAPLQNRELLSFKQDFQTKIRSILSEIHEAGLL